MKARIWITLLFVIILAAAFSFDRFLQPQSVMEENAGEPVFVVDPGHGGEDGGAVSADGLKESTINLEVCLRLDDLLGFFGCPCVLTRRDDAVDYPPEARTVRKRKQADLDRRVDLVNGTNNAVLISIHQNNYPSSGPHGAQVFYRDERQSMIFAEYAQKSLFLGTRGDIRSASVISDSIYLMRMVRSPAILIECGFLSNAEDLKLLRSEAYQTRLALCMACACTEYSQEWEREYGQGSKG